MDWRPEVCHDSSTRSGCVNRLLLTHWPKWPSVPLWNHPGQKASASLSRSDGNEWATTRWHKGELLPSFGRLQKILWSKSEKMWSERKRNLERVVPVRTPILYFPPPASRIQMLWSDLCVCGSTSHRAETVHVNMHGKNLLKHIVAHLSVDSDGNIYWGSGV